MAWRWTDEKHAVLSERTLAQMHPVAPDEAARLFVESREYEHADGLREDRFTVSR